MNILQKIISKFIYSILFPLLGSAGRRQLVLRYLRYAGPNLRGILQEAQGVMKWESADHSGETYCIRRVLPSLFQQLGVTDKPLVFDVGANRGQYITQILDCFPKASLHAFEPNPHCFQYLQQQPFAFQVTLQNRALSNKQGSQLLFTETKNQLSELSSFNKSILVALHEREQDVSSISVSTSTIDDYCSEHRIADIDFIKIDTEGHELEVLKGAAGMIQADRIKIIQFEFNEMNIYNRIFLKDFYDILPGYHFYRLDTDRLIALHSYHPSNEIFQFQNILAIHPSLHAV